VSARSCFVCIVDDDPDIREIVAIVLEARGYRVVSARDGAEALSALRHDPHACCLILLDLMMPGMSGWEFRAVMTTEPDLAKIPVIVLSGVRDVAKQAAQIEAVACLQKPVDIERLLAEVDRHC
jgi:CheY-like chemotaxis protein